MKKKVVIDFKSGSVMKITDVLGIDIKDDMIKITHSLEEKEKSGKYAVKRTRYIPFDRVRSVVEDIMTQIE